MDDFHHIFPSPYSFILVFCFKIINSLLSPKHWIFKYFYHVASCLSTDKMDASFSTANQIFLQLQM